MLVIILRHHYHTYMDSIRPLSSLLDDVKQSLTDRPVSFAQLLEQFHERGFGFFLFLFALPAALPLPGLGVNTIIALPLLILTAQMMIGRHTIWLPNFLRTKAISAKRMDGFISGALPWVIKFEKISKPRLGFITQAPVSLLLGVICFMMAIAVAIPLPLTNTVPSMGLALIGAGLMMRDGLVIIGGTLIGIAWIGLLILSAIIIAVYGIDLIETLRGFIGI